MNSEELHRDAIVIDMTCPLARMTEYIDWWGRQYGAAGSAGDEIRTPRLHLA